MNRQVVVRFRDLPAAILFLLLSRTVGEQFFLNFRAVAGRRLVFVSNDDAVFPSGVFAGVQTWPVDRVRRYVAKFFFAVQSRDLVFLKDLPEFVRISPLDLVDPLDEVRFVDRRRGSG